MTEQRRPGQYLVESEERDIDWRADTTLDTGWRGPHTEQIRRRGYGLAWAMAHRLAGVRLARPGWVADG